MRDYYEFSSIKNFEDFKEEIPRPSRKIFFNFKRYAFVGISGGLDLKFPNGFPEPNVLVCDSVNSFYSGIIYNHDLLGRPRFVFSEGKNDWAVFLYHPEEDNSYLWISSRRPKRAKSKIKFKLPSFNLEGILNPPPLSV